MDSLLPSRGALTSGYLAVLSSTKDRLARACMFFPCLIGLRGLSRCGLEKIRLFGDQLLLSSTIIDRTSTGKSIRRWARQPVVPPLSRIEIETRYIRRHAIHCTER